MVALLQIELIKTLKRRAFWVSLGLFLLFFLPIMAAAFGRGGSLEVNGQKLVSIALPQGWGLMLDLQGLDVASMARLFLPVIVCIFVGSEFVFKTSRQNIIDGLTREQFFIAKMVFVVFMAMVFFIIYLLLVLTFGYILVDRSEITESLIRGVDFQMMGAFFVMLIGFGLIATLFGIASRNTGTAIGLFFFYSTVIEQIAPSLLRLKESLRPFAEYFNYLPINIFREVVKPARYDAEFFAAKVARMGGQPLTFDLTTQTVWACAALYIVLLGGESYLLLKKSDL
jgi:ABC-type transport system involved in multi-copper enzyme maturation permease subunit